TAIGISTAATTTTPMTIQTAGSISSDSLSLQEHERAYDSAWRHLPVASCTGRTPHRRTGPAASARCGPCAQVWPPRGGVVTAPGGSCETGRSALELLPGSAA